MDTLTITPTEILKAEKDIKRKVTNGLPWQLKAFRFFFSQLGPYMPGLAGRLALYLFATPAKRGPAKALPPLFQSANAFDLPFQKGKLRIYNWGVFGPRVLLVHGWESQATTFRHMIPYLLSQGFRVVAFDGPAHGQSSGRSTTFPQFGQAIQAVLDYFAYSGGVSHLIGHSFGAYTASFMLTKSPGRIPLKKLIAISMPTKVSMATDNFFSQLKIPVNVQRSFLQKLEALAGRKMEDYDMEERFEQINSHRVLLIHDINDEVIPVPERFNDYRPQQKVECLITDGFGHYRIIKEAPVIERITNFLSS